MHVMPLLDERAAQEHAHAGRVINRQNRFGHRFILFPVLPGTLISIVRALWTRPS
jgi:hypothetical protein